MRERLLEDGEGLLLVGIDVEVDEDEDRLEAQIFLVRFAMARNEMNAVGEELADLLWLEGN